MLASNQADATGTPVLVDDPPAKKERLRQMRALNSLQVIHYHRLMPLIFLFGAIGAGLSLFFGFTPVVLFIGTGLGFFVGLLVAVVILHACR